MAKSSAKIGLWLFKEEPKHYSYKDLEKDGSATWSGIKNATARLHLRKVKAGDRVLYYHTGSQRAIIGEMRAVTDATSDPDSDDPNAVIVKVEPVRLWDAPVTLEQIKDDSVFADWELLKISRLSVMPVSEKQWRRLEALSRQNAKRGKSA
jgi:predicted RNA-binding protein with PUA-like domain